jgi:hypothetical protein
MKEIRTVSVWRRGIVRNVTREIPNNYATREEWLNAAIAHYRPAFAAQGFPLPDKVRVTCGFPGIRALATGSSNHRIGECWSSQASADGTVEIMISPVVSEPMRVLDILVHECCHAGAGNECGHKGNFKKLAKAMGLVGKMTATEGGDAFKRDAAPILDELGAYPHAALDARVGRKKQTTRMLKCECAECGYTVRISQKWLDDVGAPHCPDHGEMAQGSGKDEDEAGE